MKKPLIFLVVAAVVILFGILLVRGFSEKQGQAVSEGVPSSSATVVSEIGKETTAKESAPVVLEPLRENQKEDLKKALAQVKQASGVMPRYRIYYSMTCSTCAKNADDILRVIEGSGGGTVTAISSQADTENHRGVTVEINKTDSAVLKRVDALKNALKAANIPFKTKQTKAVFEEDALIFLGP